MLDKMVKELADSVKKSVQTAIDVFAKALEPRIAAIEKNSMGAEEAKSLIVEAMMGFEKQLETLVSEVVKAEIAKIPSAKDGQDGKSIELADVKTLIDAAVKSAVDEIPKPKDGEDGKTPEPELIKAYIEELVAARVAEIPAPKDGESVSVDQVKAMVAEMVKESVSAIDLPKAEHGRDALDIEILPLIDEEKSYTRGQYATHRGGLWKSYKKTHGLNGWECITDGIFKTVVNRVDDRNFCFIVERSSGGITKLPFEVESTSYKKIYVDGKEYQKGDFVTWAGSLWHCNEKTADKPGEGSDAWTLAAKKGRDYNPKVKV